jgi:hypothetical protein
MKYRLFLAVPAVLLCLVKEISISQEVIRKELRTPSPMAVEASPASLQKFLRDLGDSEFLTFPETREHPISMFDGIPEIWAHRSRESLMHFEASPRPGEYFTFQIGVYAHRKDLRDLKVTWSRPVGKPTISAKEFTCFNTSGVNFRGEEFQKAVSVGKGRVQPLWFGVQIPPDAKGPYRFRITVGASNARTRYVDVRLNASGSPVVNHGFDSGKNLSRLAWLNTTLGEDDATTKGYEPLHRTGDTLKILGRSVMIGPNGFPGGILSYFEPSNQFLLPRGEPLLNGPFRFVIEKENGETIHLQPGRLQFGEANASSISWRVKNTSTSCDVLCAGRMEYDGFVDYRLILRAKKSMNLRDIRLEVPMQSEKSTYMMGLNHEGGLRPPEWKWRWDVRKHQDILWVGAVNGGMRIKWKAENYVRPLINIYYAYGPLHLPTSWGNGGKGGVDVSETNGYTLINAYSGARRVRPGDTLHYDFELLITPFRSIDKNVRFNDRYFHGGGTNTGRKIAMADSVGANVINIHHAEDIYPFINYPYIDENTTALTRLAEDAHQHNKRLKVYYTTRELTKNLPEFWPLFSLNGEVIYPGPGDECRTIINPNGPDEWLKRNLKKEYIPAWLNVIKEGPFKGELDLSVITTPDSRLNNFYIGGLDWMLGHLGIDGVYIDDSALDRLTVRRARKLIDHYRPQGRIDFHTWNHFNDMAGWTNCLNLYMDLLPYFDLIWVGEGRNYDRMPDHWLIEVSGIPFGLTGQMLNGGGNPWRGMVYAITNRPGWAGDPSHLWKFWDAHQIQDKQMVGYWDKDNPISCTNDSLRVTLYKGNEESILAVANWGSTDQSGRIIVDWGKLGYDSSTCVMTIPAVPEFQNGQTSASLGQITVPGKQGYLMVLRNKAVKE